MQAQQICSKQHNNDDDLHLHHAVGQLLRSEVVERAGDVNLVADDDRPHQKHLHLQLKKRPCSFLYHYILDLYSDLIIISEQNE